MVYGTPPHHPPPPKGSTSSTEGLYMMRSNSCLEALGPFFKKSHENMILVQVVRIQN